MLPEGLRSHFVEPRRSGELARATGVGRAENAACGDLLSIQVRVEAGCLAEARFQARACSAVIALASAALERVEGGTAAAARDLDVAALAVELGGLPPGKGHAAAVVERALAGALA
jgi:NifU-like protein involved in Fe-S cluster formation